MAERRYGAGHAGAGDAGKIVLRQREDLGACPGCAAELVVGVIDHPHTGKPARCILHPVPFCNYYGATDPDDIERDIKQAKELS